jgi:hypothetical protein
MKFLDANLFIYAYYTPKKQLTDKEKKMKEFSKKIISDISYGKEDVLTTVVHLSEIVNILKNSLSSEQLAGLIRGFFMLENVKIVGVSAEAYLSAAELGEELKLEVNDALAVDIMLQNDIKEIYSFDGHFDSLEGILRLPSI